MSSSLGIRSIGQRLSRASTATTTLAARRSLLQAERSNNGSTTAAAVRCLVTTRQQLHTQQQQQQQPAVPQRQPPRQPPPRQFHASALVLNDSDDADDTANLSPKEKKKLLKAKAKAAAAEAAEQQEEDDDDAADRKKALQEKLAAKKAAQEAPPAVEEPEAPPAAEETAAAPPPPAEDQEAGKSQTEPVQFSTPEQTADAAKHKAGLDDPDRPFYQNPLHHNNPEMQKVFREDFDSDEAFEAAIVPTPPLDLGDGSIAAPEYLHALADEIVHLNMLEMNELVNKIADHYGFHEGMLSPDSDGGEEGEDDDDDAGEAAPKEEAKTVFDIKLVEFDAKAKIKVIKEVRALAGLGLKEAKELVEGAPKVIHKDVKKEEAEEIKAKLEELGATIEIV